MKRYSFIFLLIFSVLVSQISKAQNKKPEDFVPKGYVILEKEYGDLNNDGTDDCILIIKATDKKGWVINSFGEKVDPNRRGIIVLFKKNNSYELASKNYSCFVSENEEGGVYFPSELYVEVKKGKLYVNFAHGRYGYWGYTFRYQNSDFELIGYDSSASRGPVIYKETSINFLTKKKLTREDINWEKTMESGDEVFKETWEKVKVNKLIRLSEIKDFNDLDMYSY